VATNIPYPRECGGTVHVRGEVRELRRRGHKIALCAKSEPGLEEGKIDGMPVHRFSWHFRDVWAFQAAQRWAHGMRAARIARDFRADVVYERESSLGSGAVAASLAKLPLVVEVNDTWWHRSSLERAARIVSTTGENRSVVPSRYHGKTRFIDCGVDAAYFEGAAAERIAGAEAKRLVGYTGSLLAWHGIEDLAAALPILIAQVPDVALLVGGEARTPEGRALVDRLEKSARTAGLPGALIMLGNVPYNRMPGVLAACDVCVAPYDPSPEPKLRELGFFYSPMKVWDYMAAGRAIVASDVGNLSRMLAQGRGVLVPPGDPHALAGAVIGLLGDSERRARMGASAQEYAKQHSFKVLGDEYEGAILEAVREGGGPAA
jgi:glycosyltransferase involved in cell wall biosynthesis